MKPVNIKKCILILLLILFAAVIGVLKADNIIKVVSINKKTTVKHYTIQIMFEKITFPKAVPIFYIEHINYYTYIVVYPIRIRFEKVILPKATPTLYIGYINYWTYITVYPTFHINMVKSMEIPPDKGVIYIKDINYWTYVRFFTLKIMTPRHVLECDFNGNGRLDIGDVILLLRILVGTYHSNIPCDLNHNGKLDIGDAILLLRELIGSYKPSNIHSSKKTTSKKNLISLQVNIPLTSLVKDVYYLSNYTGRMAGFISHSIEKIGQYEQCNGILSIVLRNIVNKSEMYVKNIRITECKKNIIVTFKVNPGEYEVSVYFSPYENVKEYWGTIVVDIPKGYKSIKIKFHKSTLQIKRIVFSYDVPGPRTFTLLNPEFVYKAGGAGITLLIGSSTSTMVKYEIILSNNKGENITLRGSKKLKRNEDKEIGTYFNIEEVEKYPIITIEIYELLNGKYYLVKYFRLNVPRWVILGMLKDLNRTMYIHVISLAANLSKSYETTYKKIIEYSEFHNCFAGKIADIVEIASSIVGIGKPSAELFKSIKSVLTHSREEILNAFKKVITHKETSTEVEKEVSNIVHSTIDIIEKYICRETMLNSEDFCKKVAEYIVMIGLFKKNVPLQNIFEILKYLHSKNRIIHVVLSSKQYKDFVKNIEKLEEDIKDTDNVSRLVEVLNLLDLIMYNKPLAEHAYLFGYNILIPDIVPVINNSVLYLYDFKHNLPFHSWNPNLTLSYYAKIVRKFCNEIETLRIIYIICSTIITILCPFTLPLLIATFASHMIISAVLNYALSSLKVTLLDRINLVLLKYSQAIFDELMHMNTFLKYLDNIVRNGEHLKVGHTFFVYPTGPIVIKHLKGDNYEMSLSLICLFSTNTKVPVMVYVDGLEAIRFCSRKNSIIHVEYVIDKDAINILRRFLMVFIYYPTNPGIIMAYDAPIEAIYNHKILGKTYSKYMIYVNSYSFLNIIGYRKHIALNICTFSRANADKKIVVRVEYYMRDGKKIFKDYTYKLRFERYIPYCGSISIPIISKNVKKVYIYFEYFPFNSPFAGPITVTITGKSNS